MTESLRDRQRAQIRADIRRAAFRLFVERGYDAVTTEEIAAAAGVSPRTFFRHVPTKEELLLAPVRHGGAAIVGLLEERPAAESPDLNLYVYPAEADYHRQRPLGPTWHRIDTCVRDEAGGAELPDDIRHGDGALIYLSLG